MALIGSITNFGEIQGQINDANGVLTGVISSAELIGGQVVGMRGLKGDKGDTGDTGETGVGIASIAKTSTSGLQDTYTITFDDGTTTTFVVTNGEDGLNGQNGHDGHDGRDGIDGVSPTAYVVKSGDTATITITDQLGTTEAEVYDGQDGADGADGADGQDGYSPSASVSKVGNKATITITDKDGTTTADVYDGSGGGGDVTDVTVDGTSIVDQDGVAVLETATSLRDGLMTAIDFQKLSGIQSGAEVNVQSDWNEADSTDDAYIKNKPTIPTKVSDLSNDSGFITTETDPTVPSWAKQSTKPTYTASEVGALPSDGGTLTGALNGTSGTFSGSVNAYTHNTKVSSIDQTTTPSSDKSQNVLVSRDANNKNIGVAYSIQRSTGEIGFAFGAFRTINGTDYSNYAISEIKDDGTQQWRFTNAASFVNGLGLGDVIRPSTKASTGWGFSSNQSRSGLTISVASVSGYTPYVYFAYCSSHSAIDVIDASISGTTLTFWAVNRTSSAVSNVNFAFRIFYIKDVVLGANVAQ